MVYHISMKFSVVTIFPDIIHAYLGESIVKRAISAGLLRVDTYNLRDYTTDRHRSVDDYPYGGGPGMVMKPEPFFRLIETVWPDSQRRRIVLLSPQGRRFDQTAAAGLASESREVVLLCGRYEAVDERVRRCLVDDEISTGDYILTGGELPALVIIDAVARLLPGVLGDCRSSEEDSFSSGLLDHPHYTRPEDFRGMAVPEVLLSGNHEQIRKWRRRQSLKATLQKRPDLVDKYSLSEEDRKMLGEIKEECNEPG